MRKKILCQNQHKLNEQIKINIKILLQIEFAIKN
jgi:hypothetical protein